MDKIEKEKNKQCLFTLLRDVSLVGNPEILPYRNVDMDVIQINHNQIKPSASYVLEDNLNDIRTLFDEMGDSIWSLEGVYNFKDGSIIIPPILEEHTINKTEELILIDGQHRIYVARERCVESINVVVIRNCFIPCPVLPLESWDDVNLVNQIPRVKRVYNPEIPLEEISYYYRNLPGSSGERKINNIDI